LPDVDTGEVMKRPLAALVNNDLVSLSFKVEVNASIEPVYLDSAEGVRTYRRSLCFVLAMAATRVFPEHRLVIGHSLGDGYYYHFPDRDDLSERDVSALESQMLKLVGRKLDITRHVLSYADALEHFTAHRMPDTAALLEHRNDSKVAVYECDGYRDLSHGPLAPNTEVLQAFAVVKYGGGFILRFPSSRDPYRLGSFRDIPIIFSVYQEYKEWGRILEVGACGDLNSLTRRGGIEEFIQVAEALHEKKIAEISDRINRKSDSVRVVLIAGPSSSGKTTFTKRLAIQLRVHGMKPAVISLDDYFLPRDQTPRDEDGNYDFESIRAIDVEALNQDLLDLFAGEEVAIPSFNFKTGEREYNGRKLRLEEGGVLLLEGIHGLNDELTPRIESSRKYKVYVSALTQLNIDDHNRIPTTDNRLVRRMVRDYQFRGHSALDTLTMWPSVRRGENAYIFPYQDSADSAFNSALDYELGVLRGRAYPLLQGIKPFHEVYHEATRLLSFLDNFLPIPDRHIPRNSILREFVGGSRFHY
jgi:uridine kinase